MFGRGGIGPMPGGAGTGFRSAEPDEHRPAGRIANVAHRPVAALAPPVGQVMAAHRLGITREAARQFGSVAGHHATSRGALRLCCVEAVDRPRDSAQSRMRNITLGATYSVLCAVEHKTDAATGEHGDLLDLIGVTRGLDRLPRRRRRGARFLSLPRARARSGRAAHASAGAGRIAGSGAASVRHVAADHRHTRGSVFARSRHYGFARNRQPALPSALLLPPGRDTPTETWPAMIAAVTDLAAASPAPIAPGSIRRFIGGSARRRSTRRAARWAIFSATPCASVWRDDVLAAGEGIETMLSLRCVLPDHADGRGALGQRISPPSCSRPTLRRLYVARDNDPAGDRGDGDSVRPGAGGAASRRSRCRPGSATSTRICAGSAPARSGQRSRVQLAPQDVARFMRAWRRRPETG